ncbi:L-threonylcarbamoyladenylate synthase [Macrococcus equipercicus]|uniref:Threonylcarbamoyl-AMP synthase n=1 Tax=Macrococcus equipercicus TaxID=69967 RepID=A0A9Q9BW68_9STAP|nr:L-threonylcarbamoyladenylate synthase [Macrococcus equipercicus]KAA1039261.1 threonylcarbamoyl-AMP synthase [Macrococcus equipercicus]UTH13552.1 threonylcarbamoyl-AMP synthase [Macrococcus equipercicus]
MKTYVWDVRNYVDELSTYPQITEIIAAFEADALVAIPTETVYGLAANAYSPAAVGKVYAAKGRPSDNPLIVHIHQLEQLDFIEYIHPAARRLMAAYWPGAISFILPVKPGMLAPQVTAGLPSVAVRMPKDPIARQLLELTKLPLAAPSANLSGRPSPTQFEHVREDLDGRIYGIIQGPDSELGIESTVLDCTSYPFKIARPGSITETMLEEVVPGCVTEADYQSAAPIAPGMKYRHYAPNSPMTLIEGGIRERLAVDRETAVIAPESVRPLIDGGHFYPLCADEDDIATAATHLYEVLRAIDHNHDVTRIIMSGFKRSEQTRALMNRIDKASAGK